MGTSHSDFTKYPRTPHPFGSKGTDDDKHLNKADSKRFVSDECLIVEEKLDGTNVGIHFSDAGDMVLQHPKQADDDQSLSGLGQDPVNKDIGHAKDQH